jgi:hypothetical protein
VEAGSLLNGIPYSTLQCHLAPTMELHRHTGRGRMWRAGEGREEAGTAGGLAWRSSATSPEEGGH